MILSGLTTGCSLSPPVFVPLNSPQFARHGGESSGAEISAPSRLVLELYDLPATTTTASMIIDGDLQSQIDETGDRPVVTSFGMVAAADVFCLGGVCDQIWLRGEAEIRIEPDHFRMSLLNLSARSEDGAIHLSGHIIRHDYLNPLVDLSEAEMVLTAGDRVITMDRDSLLQINVNELRRQHAQGVFITGSTAEEITLDGQLRNPE